MQLVLASQSPFRRSLLERLRLPFSIFNANIDEAPKPGEQADELVIRLALAKAHAYPAQEPSLVIGSDQVGFIHGQILAKPLTVKKAEEQLELMSGEEVIFYTGLCLHSHTNGYTDQFLHTTKVHFRNLVHEEIKNYVASEQPLHSCGSFQVEGLGISLLRKIESDDPTGLIGLPLIHLSAMLRRAGIQVPQHPSPAILQH